MKTLSNYVAAAALAGCSAASACATPPSTPPASASSESQTQERIVNGRRIPDWIPSYITGLEQTMAWADAGMNCGTPELKCGYRYIWDRHADVDLRLIAGIYAGTVAVGMLNDGRRGLEGHFSEVQHPELMERALREADIDNDRFVSRHETGVLLNELAQENLKKK